ncbi:hypothetical protein JAAARDRAFT_197083 [Jaapia argillacea MUCL 33604]|uniref:Uncharacterized protein n=1 Tax=Jaapia argillacea MUCL 33604 TaxID=933084 RepID=A0A067PJI2_9AGAM|nr:hypothetical protein JAAARDRAFT_197083 [Jaapia argillacea MUCL 33604]
MPPKTKRNSTLAKSKGGKQNVPISSKDTANASKDVANVQKIPSNLPVQPIEDNVDSGEGRVEEDIEECQEQDGLDGIEEDEEDVDDNESYSAMEDGEMEEDGDDENLSADPTSDDDTQMLSGASIQCRKKLIAKSSKGHMISEHHGEGVIKPNHKTSNRPKLPQVERAMSVVEISSGEEPLHSHTTEGHRAHVETATDEDEPIVTFKASKSGNIGTPMQSSKKVAVSTQSSMKALTLPHTPRILGQNQVTRSLRAGNKKEGSSKHVSRLLSPVIITPNKSQSDKNCEVTNIEDANEYLKDTYSGLTPLSAVTVATGASSSEEKMVSLKDWAADGADME